VRLDGASDNGPNGLSRVEKVLALDDQEVVNIDQRKTRIGSLDPAPAQSFVAEGV
jgi:hypothetical protein